MISAAVIHLQATSNGAIHGGTGRAVHGFWFEQWEHVSGGIAKLLHQANHIQPFTLSPIMGLPKQKRGKTNVPVGQKAWVRVTTLHGDLTAAFLGRWLPKLPQRVCINGIEWEITHVSLSASEHKWAGMWEERYEQQPLFAAPQKWVIHLKTPTAFKVNGDILLPFPMPINLIYSWCRRWEAYGNQPLPPIDKIAIEECLLVSAYDLRTVPVRYGRRLSIGCVGQITLSTKRLPPETRATIDMLVAYAFFCGSGRHTTQGMGMTLPQ